MPQQAQMKQAELTLSIADFHGVCVPIIKRGASLPAAGALFCTKAADVRCETVDISVCLFPSSHFLVPLCKLYEGERVFARDNRFVCSFSIPLPPRTLRAGVLIRVVCELAADGSCKMTGEARFLPSRAGTNPLYSEEVLAVERTSASRSAEVESALRSRDEHAAEDEAALAETIEHERFQEVIYGLLHAVERSEFKQFLSKADRKAIFAVISSCILIAKDEKLDADGYLQLTHFVQRKSYKKLRRALIVMQTSEQN